MDLSAIDRLVIIASQGGGCIAYGFDFGAVCGDRGSELIHVHYSVTISQGRQEYVIDPKNDLRPVRANCHAMIHGFEPALSVSGRRTIIRR